MRFEDVHDYAPLHDEIVAKDSYKLLSLIAFKPDVIFDLGANIGVFTHYAHRLFPEALVVAVEPHPANFVALAEHAPKQNVVLLNAAIGMGKIQRYPDVNVADDHITAGEGYVSTGMGYRLPDIGSHPIIPTNIEGVMFDALCEWYVKPGQRYAIKMDVEGAENLVLTHPASIEALRQAEFFAAELHPYWGGTTNEGLATQFADVFRDTHRWDSEPPLFFAWRKPFDEPIAGRGEFGKLLAAKGLRGEAAEIGVCTGVFSRDILGWPEVTRLYSIDPWRELADAPCGISNGQHEEYYRQTVELLRPFGERSRIMRMLGAEAARQIPDGSLVLAYIDANHRYEGISVDLPTWWTKVQSGGIAAGHDYLTPSLGVNRAVTEFAAARGLTVHTVIEHQEDASFWIQKP